MRIGSEMTSTPASQAGTASVAIWNLGLRKCLFFVQGGSAKPSSRGWSHGPAALSLPRLVAFALSGRRRIAASLGSGTSLLCSRRAWKADSSRLGNSGRRLARLSVSNHGGIAPDATYQCPGPAHFGRETRTSRNEEILASTKVPTSRRGRSRPPRKCIRPESRTEMFECPVQAVEPSTQ